MILQIAWTCFELQQIAQSPESLLIFSGCFPWRLRHWSSETSLSLGGWRFLGSKTHKWHGKGCRVYSWRPYLQKLSLGRKEKFQWGNQICRLHDFLRELCLREAEKEKVMYVDTERCPRFSSRYMGSALSQYPFGLYQWLFGAFISTCHILDVF